MNVKQEPKPDAQVKDLQVKKAEILREPATPTMVTALPPPEPVLEGESPGTKRRQSRVESSSTSNTQALHTKHVKSAEKGVRILPAKYEFCEAEDMVVVIANMISELIQTNDSLPLRTGVLTRFHSR
jgi:hypothetical protein